jgi:hypothetical protein
MIHPLVSFVSTICRREIFIYSIAFWDYLPQNFPKIFPKFSPNPKFSQISLVSPNSSNFPNFPNFYQISSIPQISQFFLKFSKFFAGLALKYIVAKFEELMHEWICTATDTPKNGWKISFSLLGDFSIILAYYFPYL